ncbi:MAG TPA: hypothetical protein VFW62_08235 [bacterium]|nr:hypothetical protein [bacterium]
MPVAPETILSTMQDMEKLEMAARLNLEEIIRKFRTTDSPAFRKLALPLLRKLAAEESEHRALAERIIQQLSREKK